MLKSIIGYSLIVFSSHAAAHQPLEHQSPQKSAQLGHETVLYLNPEQTASILGDQTDLNGGIAALSDGASSPPKEVVIYIASQQAEKLLGDDDLSISGIESLNSLPATAAGRPTAIAKMGNPEEVIYISPSLLEFILGED